MTERVKRFLDALLGGQQMAPGAPHDDIEIHGRWTTAQIDAVLAELERATAAALGLQQGTALVVKQLEAEIGRRDLALQQVMQACERGAAVMRGKKQIYARESCERVARAFEGVSRLAESALATTNTDDDAARAMR
jgi:hypothetical protein